MFHAPPEPENAKAPRWQSRGFAETNENQFRPQLDSKSLWPYQGIPYPWHADHPRRRPKTAAELADGHERHEISDRATPNAGGAFRCNIRGMHL
jgi:hypothetical protein